MDAPNQGPAAHLAPPVPTEPVEVHSAPEIALVEGFLTKGPGLVYMELSDRLLVRAWVPNYAGSTNCILRGRLMRTDGQVIVFEYPFVAPATGLTSYLFDLAEGYLLDVTVQAIAGYTRGRLWVQAGIARGTLANFSTSALLISDYLNGSEIVGWPWGTPRNSLDGQGDILAVQVSNPSAGADWVYTVTAGYRTRIRSVSFLLTTSASVATREVTLIIDDGAHIVGQFAATVTQAASLAIQYTGSAAPYAPVTQPAVANIPLPPDLVLPSTYRLRSSTAAIQAADQYSVIYVLQENYIDGL